MQDQQTSSDDDWAPADAFEILQALGLGKWRIFAWTLALSVLGGVVALLLLPVYVAKASVLPPQASQGQLRIGAALDAVGVGAGLGSALRTQDDLFAALLRSDAVANAVIAKLDLRAKYDVKTIADARRSLADAVRIESDRRSPLVTVEARDRDPEFAAQLANAHVAELRALLSRLAVTAAQQRRLLFEAQVEQAKRALSAAEVALRAAQQQSGVVSVDTLTQQSITSAAQVRAQILAKEVELQAARRFAGPQNQDLLRLQAELGGLRSQLERLEGGVVGTAANVGSNAALDTVRAFRELKYQEAVFATLVQQLQVAQLEVAREGATVQEVDVARPPDAPSNLKPYIIVLIGALVGLCLGVFVELTRFAMARMSGNARSQLSAARAAWLGKA